MPEGLPASFSRSFFGLLVCYLDFYPTLPGSRLRHINMTDIIKPIYNIKVVVKNTASNKMESPTNDIKMELYDGISNSGAPN